VPRQARLLVIEGSAFREIELGAFPLAAGREKGCGLLLEGEGVSRVHARFEPARAPGAGHRLVDNGSRNGVEVNGARVQGSLALSPNDLIQIGDRFLVYDPDGGLNLAELLDRLARKGPDAFPAPGAAEAGRPGREGGAFDPAELLDSIRRAPLDFDPPGAEEEAAPGPAREALARRRAEEPFRGALALSALAASFFEFEEGSAPEALCKRAARGALDALGGDKALVMLRPPGAGEEDLEIGALALRGELGGALVAPSAARLLGSEGKAFVSADPASDPLLAEDAAELRADGAASLVGVPLMAGGEPLGFLLLESRDPRRRYGPASLRCLAALGEHLGHHLARLL
jgi:GAF domain-containing protein